jgi:hypothetical protein
MNPPTLRFVDLTYGLSFKNYWKEKNYPYKRPFQHHLACSIQMTPNPFVKHLGDHESNC